MQKVFSKGAELEKLAKESFSVPPFLMMENAAKAMADFILTKPHNSVFIVCGKGNNGGDGYALARLLLEKAKVTVLSVDSPTAEEAETQFQMCSKLGIEIISSIPSKIVADIIVDCIYGIGFHGDLKPEIITLLDKLNKSKALKIACDISSGLYFKADYTLTMGEQKTCLYSDKAKDVSGEIIVCDLGFPRNKFEEALCPDAFLIEEDDMILPLRTKKSSHKGTYGHTAVFAGEKSGAGIIAATAAMNFGSGLTTIIKGENSNLEQFKISPELMLSENIPEKTTCIVIGPGFGNPENSKTALNKFISWFKSTKNPNAVIDADLLTWKDLPQLLEELNSVENAKIVLTPHLSELSRFVKEYDVKTLAESAETKLKLARDLNIKYPDTTVVMKSANTFIAAEEKVYICGDGVQSLAKGGSGDVLAGMIGALLSQGYSAKDAAISAVECHALAAKKTGATAYDMTPEKLINLISTFS